MIRQEDRIRSFDGTELYLQLWQARDPKGLMVLTHGMAEHSDCYSRIVERWDLREWDVVGWDLRGHGQSEGQRGYIETFEDFTRDLHQVLAYLDNRTALERRPLVLFGHSMGGLITFSAALKYPNWPISGVVLSAPLFGVALQVPYWKDRAANLLAKYLPRLTLSNGIDYRTLTHDENLIPSYQRDPLRHEKVSPSLYLALQEQMQWAETHAAEWKWPLLLQLAGEDKIVSTPKSLDVFQHIPSRTKRVQTYPNYYHEIYNELGCEVVDADLRVFLQETLSTENR